MDAAASVIAVIQITEQVVTLCYDYLKAVKNAVADIRRLQDELRSLETILRGAQKLLDGPYKEKLETSQCLRDSLIGCRSDVKDLKARLTAKSKGMRHRLGVGRLKWPFESKDVDNIIRTLHKHRDNLGTGLAIDQT